MKDQRFPLDLGRFKRWNHVSERHNWSGAGVQNLFALLHLKFNNIALHFFEFIANL